MVRYIYRMFINYLFCLKSPTKNKKITFSDYTNIMYIPYNDDYKSKSKLWWSDIDIYLFKKSSINEIKNLMNRHPNMKYKDASKLLYQPGNMTIKYDETNFL